jgi:hypothetical protein
MYIFMVYKFLRMRDIRFVLVYYILRFFWKSRRFVWLYKTTSFRDSQSLVHVFYEEWWWRSRAIWTQSHME